MDDQHDDFNAMERAAIAAATEGGAPPLTIKVPSRAVGKPGDGPGIEGLYNGLALSWWL